MLLISRRQCLYDVPIQSFLRWVQKPVTASIFYLQCVVTDIIDWKKIDQCWQTIDIVFFLYEYVRQCLTLRESVICREVEDLYLWKSVSSAECVALGVGGSFGQLMKLKWVKLKITWGNVLQVLVFRLSEDLLIDQTRWAVKTAGVMWFCPDVGAGVH